MNDYIGAVEVLKEFETSYKKMGKHRKRCSVCRKLIADGAMVEARQLRLTKSYPVKGLMWFIRWKFAHLDCIENTKNERNQP